MSQKKQHVSTVNSTFGILLSSGVPFLTRQFGERQIPFSVIGSLGGLFTYTSNNGGILSEFTTCGYTIRFSTYNETLLLIHLTDDISLTKTFIRSFLDQLNFLILAVLGLDNLKKCQNADIAKRSTNKVIPTLSLLIEKFEVPALTLSAYPVATFSTSIVKSWQDKLEKCLELLETNYGCVLSNSSIVMMSDSLKNLPREECSALMSLFMSMVPGPGGVTNHDIYLPKSSPNNPFALYICSYPPYTVFAICPKGTTTEHFTEALHKSFTISKSQFVVKQSPKDGVRFDNCVISLVAIQGQEMIHYVPDKGDRAKSGKLLSEALSNRTILDELEDGKDIKCVMTIGGYPCHISGNKDFLVAALFKKGFSFFVIDGIVKEIVDYYKTLK